MTAVAWQANSIARPVGRRINWPWLLLGAAASVKVSIGGEIYLGELVAAAALPLWLLRGRLNRHLLWILAIALMWSSGQLLSDLINQTDGASMLKGVFAPIVFAATLVSLARFLAYSPERVYSFLFGVALFNFVRVVLMPDSLQIDAPWKFGYGPAVLGLLLVWLSFFGRSRPMRMVLALLAYSALCIVYSSRSLAMFPLVGLAMWMFWNYRVGTRLKRWLRGRAGPIKLGLLVIIPVMLANAALTAFFSSGVLDSYLEPDVAQKYRQQASADVGVLLAGRSESLISVEAYLDAPWFGHGSWALDQSGYNVRYAALRYRLGILERATVDENPLIPAHSYILGAMVWSGVAGGLFWLLFTFNLLGRYLRYAQALPLYFHVGVVTFAWNLLFSPFGADARWALAVFVAALYAWCELVRKRAR